MSKMIVYSCPNPAEMLTLMTIQKYLPNQCVGQLVRIPGAGLRIRKSDPALKDMTVEECMAAADVLIQFDDPGDEITHMCMEADLKMQSPDDAIASAGSYSAACELHIALNPDSFPRIIEEITHLFKLGYCINLRSCDSRLDTLLRLFRPVQSEAELNLYLDISADAEGCPENVYSIILAELRRNCPRDRYVKRMLDHYRRVWRYSMHRLPKAQRDIAPTLYFSCSRKTLRLAPAQSDVLCWLEEDRIIRLQTCRIEALEDVSALLMEEEYADAYIKMLLSTGHARIANGNDAILSYIGSRRCNMRCSYCFSDHTCESLSRMSAADTLCVADMVREYLPADVKLHFDTNLGGEPLCDWEGVKRRHNALLNYHKTTGMRASFGLLTNGTLLNAGHLQWLRKTLPYVGFSLDGDQKTSDRVRRDAGLKPTYDRAVEGIRLVQNSNWPAPPGVSCVLTKHNLDIQGLQQHFRNELDVHHVVMKPVRAAESEDYALTYDDIPAIRQGYGDFFDFLHDEACKGNLDPLFTMLQPLDYAGRFLLRSFFADRLIVKRCGAGEIIHSVDDQGHVFPCDSFNGVEDKEIGNLTEGMHNRSGFKIPYVTEKEAHYGCSKCWARYLCGGICEYVTHLNDYVYNDVLKMECELSRFLVESALAFWARGRAAWTEETLRKIGERAREIGFAPVSAGSFVYAPC